MFSHPPAAKRSSGLPSGARGAALSATLTAAGTRDQRLVCISLDADDRQDDHDGRLRLADRHFSLTCITRRYREPDDRSHIAFPQKPDRPVTIKTGAAI